MDVATTDPHDLQIDELVALIKVREVSPVAATRAQFDRIASLDGEVGSYALVMADAALISRPGGFTEAGMPMAFRLVAADMQEAKLVRAGAAYQGVTSWHRHHPSL